MSFDPQDPKWTAYVVGELDDDARSEIEAELANSADAQRYVDELRRTINLLSTELQAEPCPGMADREPAPAAVYDEWSDVRTELAHSIRPEGHSRSAGRKALLALAASLLAAVGMGSYLLAPNLWHVRDLKLAWKSDRNANDAFRQSTPDGETLDDSSLEAPQTGPNPAIDYVEVPSDDLPEVKLQLENRRLLQGSPHQNSTTSASGSASGTLGGMGGGMAGKPGPGKPQGPKGGKDLRGTAVPLFSQIGKVETFQFRESSGEKGQAQSKSANPRYETKTRSEGRPGKERGVVDSLEQVETSPIPFPADEPISYPDQQVWDELSKRRKKWTESSAPAGAPARVIDQESRSELLDVAASSEKLADAGVDRHVKDVAAQDGITVQLPSFVDPETGAQPTDHAAEAYDNVTDNPFLPVADNPLSTFSIDVDTASYSIVRRYLQQNHQLPPRSAVRIEELVNYFRYDYPQPEGDKPFAANVEVAGCPWNAEHRLVRVGIKGREVARDRRPLANLVFLIDVSGSMQSPDKLPLVKESMRLLAGQMGENDRVAIVVYAGSSGLVLPSTSGTDKPVILRALDSLEAGGSTNGAQGIQLAYDMAVANFIKGGVNRVILATDGDFNVGVTDRGELVRLIEQKAASGVFLTTLGYGMGNLKDATLEQLADKGNGNYAYIDDIREAKKVLVEQMSGTLVTIAKDVKIQIEFNPTQVAAFRLIGYENRILRHEDFNDDKKDAGDIGAGHTVTALYELVPAGKEAAAAPAPAPAAVDPLKYQQKLAPTDAARTAELLTLKLRYKQPDGERSQLLEYPVKDAGLPYARATGDFKFAASVALFGMLLRDSPYKGTASFAAAAELAQEGRGSDAEGYRAEFIELISAAKALR